MIARAMLVLALLAASAQAGDTRVKWLTRHHYVPEQELVTYDLHVPRHPENRRLFVAAVAEDGHVSESRIQLDGEASKTLYGITLRLPAGPIVLVAVLFGRDGLEVARASHPLDVQEAFPK
jgi:hypothetical protein